MSRTLAKYPWMLKVWALVVALLLSPAVAAADQAKRVLLLHSFGPHFAPYSTFSAEFRAELVRRSPAPLDIYEQSVDSARFSDAGGAAPFLNYIHALFGPRPPDLVVTIGGPAAGFVHAYRDQLFPAAPTLLTALADRVVHTLDLASNEAVLALHLELPAVVENILQLLPKTRRIFLVLGDSPIERFWAEHATEDFRRFGHIDFEISNHYSFEQALERVASLPPDTAVLYGGITVDANGVPYEGDQAVERFSDASAAPVFGLYDNELGLGIVGGPLLPIAGQAPQAAVAVALRLLEGEAPGGLRLPAIGAEPPAYDARELERWGISETRLPAGSVVRFREPTVWGRYRLPIVAAATVLFVQGALILALLVGRRRIQRSKATQRQSEQRLSLAAEAADLGLWERDFTTDELWASMGCRRLLSLPEEGPVTLASFLRAIHPADRSTVLKAVDRATAGGGDFEAECRLATDGVDRWVATRGQVEFAPDGSPARLRGVTLDITERRQAEQAAHAFSGKLIQAQEDERSRLARELHDDVTQRLAVLAIDAGQGELKAADATDRARLRGIREGLVRLSEDVHALSYRLHPSILADLGLLDALRAECDRFARVEAIPVRVEACDLPDDLPADIALCLFRVAQEALRSVARHAGAASVAVALWRSRTKRSTRASVVFQRIRGGFIASISQKSRETVGRGAGSGRWPVAGRPRRGAPWPTGGRG